MDDQQTAVKANNSMKIVIPVVIAALIVLGALGVVAYQGMKSGQTQTPVQQETVTTGTPTQTETMASETPSASKYKDGEYSATGDYVSPGGPREIDLTLTIKDGVITGSEFTGHATDPNSKRFQGEFADNYKTMVVGKNLDEVSLTKVSGSSLTPKGFMDALTKIKEEAQT